MQALLAAERVTRTACLHWCALSMASASLNSVTASAGGMGSIASWMMKLPCSDKDILLRITACWPTGRSS